MWYKYIPLASFLLSATIVLSQSDCEPLDSLAPSDSWQIVSGNYGAGGSVTYQVAMNLGVNYIFKTGCGDGATADHDTRIEWLAPTTPNCTVIMQDDDGCEAGRSLLNFESFFSDGMALRIRVSGAQGQAGNFTMAYRTIGGTPGTCNECPAYDEQIFPSSLWQTVDGSYGNDGCRVYQVQGTAGLEYTFKTGCGDGASADNDTRIELFKTWWPACDSLTSDDNSCENGRSSVTWTPAPGNTSMHVRVSGADGSSGNFTMAYRAIGGNGSLCGACTDWNFNITPTAAWHQHSSSHLADGCQVYRVAMEDGFSYTFKTGCGNGASADHDTYLELFDGNCTLLAANDNACDDSTSALNYTADTTGIFYLRVSGANDAEGFYTLAWRKEGPCTVCPAYDTLLTPGLAWQTDSGSYWAHGCRMYKVNVLAGHTYVFQTDYGHGASADHLLSIDLLDGACTPFPQGPQWPGYSTNQSFLFADSTGVAFVQVHGVDDAFGNYVMAYRDVGTSTDLCQDAGPIEIGGNASVQLSGTLADATSTGDFPAGSSWEGLPVKWYALDMSDWCNSFTVSYCGQNPAWLNTMNFITDSCGGGNVFTAGPVTWDTCQDGNVQYFFQVQPGLYYLPLLYDPANSVDGNYTITLSCMNLIIEGINAPTLSNWTIHPNPGHEGLWLQTEGAVPTAAIVHVTDIFGRTVLQESINDSPTWIGMSEVPSGVYVIRVEGTRGVIAQRWVKQ